MIQTTYSQQFRTLLIRRLQQIEEAAEQKSLINTAAKQNQALQALDYAFAGNLETPDLVLPLLCKLAPLMEQAGHREQWLNTLIRGCTLARQVNKVDSEADLSYHIAILLHRQSKFEQAKQWLKRGLRCYQRTNNTQGQSQVLHQLAHIAYYQHEYDTTRHLLEQAAPLAGDNRMLQAMTYFLKGLLAGQLQAWDEAERMHQTALQLRKACNDQRRIAWSLLDLANVYRQQTQYDKATAYYQESATILQSLSDFHFWARVQMMLGNLYIDQADAALALTYFQQAMTHMEKSNDLLHLAKIHTNMGLAHLMRNQPEAAEKAFTLSASLARRINDWSLALNAQDGLAMALIAQARHADAIASLEKSLADLQSFNHLPNFAYLSKSMQSHLAQATRSLHTAGQATAQQSP